MARSTALLRLATLLAVAGACAPASAVYKVIGPDGKVTYTDTPPNDGRSRWMAAEPNGPAPTGPAATLPAELREPVAKYPVTLYTSAECEPCGAARQLLVGRGIPFSERRVITSADAEALQQRVGGRTVPAVTIGGQTLLGLNTPDWQSYLDAAGYPKQSVLPPTYRPPEPQPLVPLRPAPPAEPPAVLLTPPPAVSEPPPAPAPASGTIRF